MKLPNCLLYSAAILLTFNSICRAQTRNITFNQPCEGLNLEYVAAVGSTDTLHYFISSIDTPSLLIARTANGAGKDVVCSWFKSPYIITVGNGISVHDPSYVYTLQFTRLFEYQDVNDEVTLPDCVLNSSCVVHKLSDFKWNPATIVDNVVTFSSNVQSGPLRLLENGSFSFSIQISGDDSRMDVSPHLKLTPNMSIVTLTLDGLNVSYPQSRFSMELLSITSDSASSQVAMPSTVTEARSVDDEFSPGIFVENNWLLGNSSAYMQWKPVAYLSAERKLGVKSVTKVAYKGPVDSFAGDSDVVGQSHTLALAYFGTSMGGQAHAAVNISFGKKGDQFYIENNYTAWAFAVGLGAPYVETISTQMILIIAIGIGVPLVLLLCGFIWMACRRRSHPIGYETIGSSSAYGSIQT